MMKLKIDRRSLWLWLIGAFLSMLIGMIKGAQQKDAIDDAVEKRLKELDDYRRKEASERGVEIIPDEDVEVINF